MKRSLFILFCAVALSAPAEESATPPKVEMIADYPMRIYFHGRFMGERLLQEGTEMTVIGTKGNRLHCKGKTQKYFVPRSLTNFDALLKGYKDETALLAELGVASKEREQLIALGVEREIIKKKAEEGPLKEFSKKEEVEPLDIDGVFAEREVYLSDLKEYIGKVPYSKRKYAYGSYRKMTPVPLANKMKVARDSGVLTEKQLKTVADVLEMARLYRVKTFDRFEKAAVGKGLSATASGLVPPLPSRSE